MSVSGTVRILGVAALLLLAGAGVSFAFVGPELDPGSAGSGVALVVGAAVLMAERYRRS